jgi:hypothetical protein
MTLGNTLKRLDDGEQVRINTEQSEYHGTVVDHDHMALIPDPEPPWFDPGYAKAIIQLDEDTVERLDLERDTLKVVCHHHDGAPSWKTPVAELCHDEKENTDLGDVTDVQTIEE